MIVCDGAEGVSRVDYVYENVSCVVLQNNETGAEFPSRLEVWCAGATLRRPLFVTVTQQHSMTLYIYLQ